MTRKRAPLITILVCVFALLSFPAAGNTDTSHALADQSAGNRPVSATPIDKAILSRVKILFVENFFVPQGLAVDEGRAFLLTYYGGSDWSKHRCALFEFDLESGRYRGPAWVDISCTHGGGLVIAPGGNLVISDLQWLFIAPIDRICWKCTNSYQRPGAVEKIRVSEELSGGMTLGRGPDGVWLTRYRREGSETAHYFQWPDIFAHAGGSLSAASAVRSIRVPAEIQGMAVDRGGNLWLSHSTGDRAYFSIVNARSGSVEKTIPAVGGIEGLAFDESGNLWSASEAGSKQWKMKTYFPFIFKLDTQTLRALPALADDRK